MGATLGPDEPTYEEICTFCDEVAGRRNGFHQLGLATADEYILHRTDNFVVVPCLGALTEWYVLIVPRRHVLSTGWLDDNERRELRALCDETVARLARRAVHEVVVFEHGSFSFRDKGGSCHDHSHVHVAASDRPVQQFCDLVSASVDLGPCDDWIEAAADHIAESGRSYLALESSGRSMIAPANDAPSAFFRKALVAWLGADEGSHDWLVYPQVERLRRMIAARL